MSKMFMYSIIKYLRSSFLYNLSLYALTKSNQKLFNLIILRFFKVLSSIVQLTVCARVHMSLSIQYTPHFKDNLYRTESLHDSCGGIQSELISSGDWGSGDCEMALLVLLLRCRLGRTS